MEKRWYILQIKKNSYTQAIRNLNQQGFETFLPLQNTTNRGASFFKDISRPLFPGYMFVKFDQSTSNWNKINNTYGVSRLIAMDSTINTVPDSLINDLKQRYGKPKKLSLTQKLSKGDRVKVLNGPFTNFFATIDTFKPGERIWILTDLMGRQTKVETKVDDVLLEN